MIPMIVRLGFRAHGGKVWRLWLPLFLVWFLLLPIILVVLPFVMIVCLLVLVNPFRFLAICWEILASFKGTQIQVQDATHLIDIDIL